MRKTMKNIWLVSSFALGIAFGQSGLYTPIDFPGASSTLVWGINNRGEMSGQYVKDGVTHGFKLAGDQSARLTIWAPLTPRCLGSTTAAT